MMSDPQPKTYRIRSFVRRSGRASDGQEAAREQLWPNFGMTTAAGEIDFQQTFGRDAPRVLEIGFGTGQSLLAAARTFPDKDFIGVETHKPGIGALMLGMKTYELTNIRAYDADVIDVLEQCIPAESLDAICIFFPDPWQKRRHHERRLIQPSFIELALKKLKPNGELHVATDWEHYSQHMLRVLSQETRLVNVAGANQFAPRSPYRPILSKFESRAVNDGRNIWDFHFRVK